MINAQGIIKARPWLLLLINPAPSHLLRQGYLPKLSPTLFPNLARQETLFLFLYLSAFARPVLEASESVNSRFTFYVLRKR